MLLLERELPRVPTASLEIDRVHSVFGKLPRNVFVVSDSAPIIARELGIPLETVVEILQTPNPVLYPDVPSFLQRISVVGSLPSVWTQGHIDAGVDIEVLAAQSELAFQSIKLVRSGLHMHLLPFGEKLSQMGIPGIFGGFDKCDPNVVLPVLRSVQMHGLERVVAVDDLAANLTQLGEICTMVNMPFTPVLIDRRENSQTGAITSFNELTVVNNSLYLIDLDRTQIGTDAMKQDLYTRLAQNLPR